DPAIRAIILAAKGPVFCAGHDLKEMTAAARAAPDGGRHFFEETMAECSAVMQAIVTCPRPVIAEVGGMATAAGCQLVASADLAVASHTAQFATPGVDIGLFCSTPMVALSRNVPRKQAMRMLLTGRPLSAEEAERHGLVSDVVPADALRATTNALAAEIASKSAATVRIGKAAFYAQAEMRLADAYSYAQAVMVENMLNRDAKEGIEAFLEKRTPAWTES
ncbi:MAG: enoyl-CoA hydratase, partial [Pseudomonadota bacterium]